MGEVVVGSRPTTPVELPESLLVDDEDESPLPLWLPELDEEEEESWLDPFELESAQFAFGKL